MADPKPPRNDFALVFAGFAILAVLSLGLCGLSRYLPSNDHEFHSNETGIISIGGMLLGVSGLVITALTWIVRAIVRSFKRKD